VAALKLISVRLSTGQTTFAWQTEAMPLPRIMGNGIILPDGTVWVGNGAANGAAR
jgi:hypothetical protein